MISTGGGRHATTALIFDWVSLWASSNGPLKQSRTVNARKLNRTSVERITMANMYNVSYNLNMKTVTAAYAKAHLAELLEHFGRGGRVTISRYHKPVADLVPAAPSQRPTPKFGTGKGRIKIIDPDWAKPMTDKEVEDFI